MIASPFQRILGQSFNELADPVRRFHSLAEPTVATGLADIDVASGPISWLICWLAGLPKSGRGVPVSVDFRPDGTGGEHWLRLFGERRYASSFRVEQRTGENLLVERFGPFQLKFRLRTGPKGLSWLLVGVTCIGIPAPKWAVPKVNCLENGDDERFLFDIEAALPLVGPLIRYRGWLVVGDESGAPR
jgi:hypothetical protein